MGSLGALGLTLRGGAVDPQTLMTIWFAAAVMALVMISVTLRLAPLVRGLAAWARKDLPDRASFGAEGIISGLNSALVMTIVTATLGLSAVAAIRGAGTLIGPLSLLLGAMPLVVAPELSRLRAQGGAALWRAARPYALAISLAATGVGSLGLLLPETTGRAVLGDTWLVAREVLPIMGLEYVFLAWMFAGSLGLRVLNMGRALLRIRLAYSVSAIAIAVSASYLDDVRYVSGGLAVVAGIYAWLMRRRLLGCSSDSP